MTIVTDKYTNMRNCSIRTVAYSLFQVLLQPPFFCHLLKSDNLLIFYLNAVAILLWGFEDQQNDAYNMIWVVTSLKSSFCFNIMQHKKSNSVYEAPVNAGYRRSIIPHLVHCMQTLQKVISAIQIRDHKVTW